MQKEIRNLQAALASVSEHSGNFAHPATTSPSFSAEHSSPANLSSKGKSTETHGMAMTRENSPEAQQGSSSGPASVLVTEPMGGLYEVTRLRNIRSNQATLDRPIPEQEDQIDDFISRGVR